ncbi:MAG: DUF4268 domain-containing protein [Candidatus Poribacteria bacterium]|nr:DUF4268 domain-containing protein [Candidatus Poribacteria bacterium]
MAEELAKLKAVELRKVWPDEAQDFTPWLAKAENLVLLDETLDMKLELEGVEISGEGFRADILCKNEDDSRVLIENQLEETDHTHLGQILTYAAGLDVQTVIWIAKKFKDEHRAALDRLNETTDKHFQYFGVEIKVWQIGDSARAPQFDVVSSPNDWSRTVIQNSQREIIKDLSEIQLQYKKFWDEFVQYLSKNNSPLSPPNPQPVGQVSFPLGKAAFTLYANLRSQAKQIRVRLTIRGNDAKKQFHSLKTHQTEIEKELGASLKWEELQGKESSWIALEKSNTDPTNEADWPNQHKWFASKLELFEKVFRPRIKALNLADYEAEDEDDE